jgi:tripartite-type tricarboxylate transporter receptor subunit TctC
MSAAYRHLFARLVLGAAFLSGAASAQVFPAKPIRWIVPFPAGGTGDVVVRTLSGPMSKSLGQSVIADFRPGGSTIVGTELAARAPADGYTLLFVSNSFTINPATRSKLPYDTLRDFAGVARIVTTPFIIAVHPSIPAKSLKELLALARSRAGEITYATAGLGGGQQIATELLSQMARVSFLHVPHQGVAPAMSSVLGGHVAMIMLNVPDVVPYAASGKLRPIAVTSANRSPALTDTPTIAESGFPGYDFQLVIGAVTMRAAPRDAVNRLSAEIVRALEQPQVRESFGKLGFVPAPLNPEQFDAFIRAELQQNEKVARLANIRID